jgi:predicted nucleic acid-binding protein
MPEKILPTGEPEKALLVADTSALVSLNIGLVLEKALEIVAIYVPQEVVNELEIHARLSDDAAHVLNLVRTGRIKVLGVQDTKRVQALVAENTQIDYGEAEAIVLAEGRNITLIITDDFEAFFQMRRATKVPVDLSPYLIAALVVTRKLSIEEAEASFERIASKRHWFDARIYERARSYLDALR